jgi:membrane associated rhomboid family serine protease
MSRYASGPVTYQFGPGGMSPAIRVLLIVNIAVFLVMWIPGIASVILALAALTPAAVVERLWIWQVGTYMFVHRDLFHILFNLLNLWMFGVELERRWGTQAFVRYFLVTGIGAGITVVLASILPFGAARGSYNIPTIGVSGAVYGIILAWALIFKDRTLMFMMMFPLPARAYAALMTAIVFYSALGSSGSGVAHFAHLGGLVVGYFYLKGPRGPRDLKLEIQYRLTKWRMDRMRKKFDVHRGGRVH